MAALAILAAPISALAAVPPPLPSWPQNFYTNAIERASFGLPVTAPGAIGVAVRTQGAPIVVTLTRPDGTPAQQVIGTGELRMSYAATPAEVAVSALWGIKIELQQPLAGAEARGSVQVQEPPIDPNAFAAFLARPKAPRARTSPMARAFDHQAKIDATRRAFMQAHAASQAARFEVIRPRLEAARARGLQPLSTRAIPPPNIAPAQLPSGGPRVIQGMPFVVHVPPPPPVIALPLYTNQGEPGDTIPIAGSGFGTLGQGSAVHLVLGIKPTDDYVAPASVWSDNEIFVTIPTVTGYPWLTGSIYVVRNSDGARSQPVTFNFSPTLDLQVYPTPPQSPADSVIPLYDAGYCQREASFSNQNPYPINGWARGGDWLGWFPCDSAGSMFWGSTSNDIFFQTVALKNGWVVDHVDLPGATGNGADCNSGFYVSQSDPPLIGSNRPRVNVRVWADACPTGDNYPIYTVDVYVKGPKGLPF
jgi:hypothetical protein